MTVALNGKRGNDFAKEKVCENPDGITSFCSH